MFVKVQEVDGSISKKEFASLDEFLMLQMREVPAIQDHLKVTEVSVDGKDVEFQGNVGELFNYFNK